MSGKKETINFASGGKQDVTEGSDRVKMEALQYNNINFLIENSEDSMMVDVEVAGETLSMLLDSGAACSIISEKIYKEKFKQFNLKKANTVIITYSGDEVKVLGSFSCRVKYDGRVKKIKFLVVKGNLGLILGRDFLKQFNFEFKINQISEKIQPDCEFEKKLEILLNKYDGLFIEGPGEYKFSTISLKYDEKKKPIFIKPREIPIAYRSAVEKELKRMEETGIIKKVENSEWGTPIVPVPQEDGTVEIYGDYKATIDQYLTIVEHPLPRIEEIFQKLEGGSVFAKIHLTSVANHLVMNLESQYLCALSTHLGIFRMCRLPQGLKSTFTLFQQEIEELLLGIEGVAVFIDNVFISAESLEELLNIIEEVFKAFTKAGLKLNREECIFMNSELLCLGHKISSEGLSKHKETVNSFSSMKVPEKMEEIEALYKLAKYFSKFFKISAETVQNLKVKGYWCAEFLKFKEAVEQDIRLVSYNLNAPLVLTIGASNFSISGILESNGRPIKCVSRSLNATELKYSVIDKKALAIVYSLKQLEEYLAGRKFLIKTDQNTLIDMFGPNMGAPVSENQRIQRWAMYLQSFNYDMEYVNTKSNIAGTLSRLRYEEEPDISGDDQRMFLNRITEMDLPVSLHDVQDETSDDKILSKIAKAVTDGNWSQFKGTEFQPFLDHKDEIGIMLGVIMWKDRIIVPESIREHMLKELHATHVGTSKMKSFAKSYFWWPNLDDNIEEISKNCLGCKENKNAQSHATSLIPWKNTRNFWSKIQLDFLGPAAGHWFLIIIESRTKWLEVYKTKKLTTKFIIEKVRETLYRQGVCDVVVSENKSQFTDKKFVDFLESNGIQQRFEPAIRSVKSIKNQLFVVLPIFESTENVEKALQEYLLAYRNKAQASSRKSPAEMLFNRPLKTRLDLIHPLKEGKKREVQKMSSSQESRLGKFMKFAGNVLFLRERKP